MAKTNKNPEVRFAGFTEDWEENKVKHLIQERNIQTPKSTEYPLMAFIANKGVAPKGNRYDRESLVIDQKNKKYKQTELGDFIYSSNNLETGSIGLNNYGKASISPVYSIFKPTANSESEFIGRLFTRNGFIKEMVRWRQGVVYGQWRIHESDFLNLKVNHPTVHEQKKIGLFYKNLETDIAFYQLRYNNLINIRKALVESLFPIEGMNLPKVRLNHFNNKWEKKNLEDIVDFLDEKRKPLSANQRQGGIYPYYGASGIIDYVKDYLFDEELILLSEDGANIINRSTRVCFLATGKYWVNNHAHVMRSKKQNDNGFICEALEQINYKKYNTGTAQPKLNQEVCRNIPLMVPSYDEQVVLSSIFKSMDSLINLYKKHLKATKNLKSACLSKMFK